jgi:HPt (histidine-containing phosphotransfer) domain-containing protein
MENPNLDYIEKLAGENTEFKSKIIQILKTEFPEEKQKYQKAIAENDLKQAAQMVHKINHKISILGLEKSFILAKEYESNLNSSSNNLQQDFELILETIATYIQELK